MKNKKLNLRLFDGEGAAAPAGNPGTGEQNSPAAAETGREELQYEDEEQAAAVESEIQVTSDTLEEKKAEFEHLIKGKYKEIFSERMQNIIDQRFKETKNLETSLSKVSPILQLIADRYGVKNPEDVDAIRKALDEDESFYEEEAMKKGMTVEQLKYMKELERNNEELMRLQQEKSQREEADRIYSVWMEQSEALKGVYPSFDFGIEAQNINFLDLLKNGIDVRTAYEVVHKDEIISGAMQYTAQTVAKKVTDSIAAKGRRPVENGTSAQATSSRKTDVNAMTKKEREELERRVARGERITF